MKKIIYVLAACAVFVLGANANEAEFVKNLKQSLNDKNAQLISIDKLNSLNGLNLLIVRSGDKKEAFLASDDAKSLVAVTEEPKLADAADAADARGAGERAPSARRSVRLTDPAGLHARPAAALAALLDDERARMRVGGSPATTLQEILALGLHGRTRLEVTVTGPHAERTLDRVERLLGGVV